MRRQRFFFGVALPGGALAAFAGLAGCFGELFAELFAGARAADLPAAPFAAGFAAAAFVAGLAALAAGLAAGFAGFAAAWVDGFAAGFAAGLAVAFAAALAAGFVAGSSVATLAAGLPAGFASLAGPVSFAGLTASAGATASDLAGRAAFGGGAAAPDAPSGRGRCATASSASRSSRSASSWLIWPRRTMYCTRSRALSIAKAANPAAAPITSRIAPAILLPASAPISCARDVSSAMASRTSIARCPGDRRATGAAGTSSPTAPLLSTTSGVSAMRHPSRRGPGRSPWL